MALSKNRSTLAISRSRSSDTLEGATGAVVEVFGLDNEGSYKNPIDVPVIIASDSRPFAAISINSDGIFFLFDLNWGRTLFFDLFLFFSPFRSLFLFDLLRSPSDCPFFFDFGSAGKSDFLL